MVSFHPCYGMSLDLMHKITRKSHVNVFEIGEAFKQEQDYTEVSIAQLATGAQPPRRAWKDNKIHKLKVQLMENRMIIIIIDNAHFFLLNYTFLLYTNISKVVLLNKTRRRNDTNLILVGKMGVGEMGTMHTRDRKCIRLIRNSY